MNMPTAVTFASNLYRFTAAPFSPARPYCDLRHRIFLSEINLRFKKFLILHPRKFLRTWYFQANSVSGGLLRPGDRGDVGRRSGSLSVGRPRRPERGPPAQEALTLRQRAWAASSSL
jgi:hypothetical protein